MKSQIKMDFLGSKLIQFFKVLLNVKRIGTANEKSKGKKLKKNELDYFEYTYITDSSY
jgi:hypothetical protein